MACYLPIPARRSENGGPWTLNPPLGEANATIPCGKCLGCRTRIQLDWTHRCTNEATLWKHNRFATLTYSPDKCPHELVPHHITTFLKRLRKAQPRDNNILSEALTIRYLACGEYGDKTSRPHYHILLFNCAFNDEKPYDNELSTSQTLDRIWGHGTSKLAPFTPAAAGYVAGYITKHGRRDYYDEDGVVLQPPFKRQSSRPAIGRQWLEKYSQNIQHGYIVNEGQQYPLPRYYKKLLEKTAANKKEGPYTKQETTIRQSNQTLGDKLATKQQETDKYTAPRLQAAHTIHIQHMAKRQRELK